MHLVAEALGQGLGEITLEVVDEVSVLGQVGVEQLLVEVDLAVGHDHRQLRRHEALVLGLALVDRVVGGQELELAVQSGGLLEIPDQPGVDVDHLRCLREREADRLRLRVAPVQDLCTDRVGHLRQQLVALLLGHVAVRDQAVEQDLDVDLVVGGVDAGDVVDRVVDDPPAWVGGPPIPRAAAEGVLDPPPLRDPEVAALAHDLAAELAPVDPDRVVGLVADVRLGLGRGLDVGADAAVVQQVDRRLEDRPDQVVGRDPLVVDVQDFADLGAERDRLGASGRTRHRPRRSATRRSRSRPSAADRTVACARCSSSPDPGRDRGTRACG